jgi:hypothetical protein
VGANDSLNYLARISDYFALVLSAVLRCGSHIKKLDRILLTHVSCEDGVKRHLSGF